MRRCILLFVPALLLSWGVAAWADEVEFGKLKSKTPSNWKAVKVKGIFRAYQFSVPKVDGDRADAEVVVFHFENGGGSADDNIKRQQKMFIPEDGKVASALEHFKVGKAEVAYLDISGTYVTKNPPFDPKAKEERHTNYRMLYVFFPTDGALYTVRLVGPAKTVEQNKKGFEEWVKNFK